MVFVAELSYHSLVLFFRSGVTYVLYLNKQLVEENFKGRFPAKAFAGTEIDLVDEGSKEGRIEGFKVG
ncbi:MAG: hypothetical protein E7333_05985 [Clostridiales bacterium]|nr:hypothetical protein [Clostridiales bacterium]